jgi:hypothetical protein
MQAKDCVVALPSRLYNNDSLWQVLGRNFVHSPDANVL